MKRIITFMLLAIAIFLVGCGENEPTENKQQDLINVYKDDVVSVDFIKVADSIITGNFELYIKAQNKSDKAITVYLKDVSINGSMVEVGSGAPCDVIAGADRTHSFFGRLDLAGVNSAEEINQITFKVWVVDEEFNTILTTTDLEVITPH